MNREIKFRVWDKDLNIMITFPNHYYKYIYFDGKPWDNPNQNPMQFTGLKDKNDKEIYEGDILQRMVCINCWTGDTRIDIHIVEFNPYTGYNLIEKEAIFGWLWEIKGNIFENPELLLDKK